MMTSNWRTQVHEVNFILKVGVVVSVALGGWEWRSFQPVPAAANRVVATTRSAWGTTASGQSGTSKWTLRNGVLRLEAGQLARNPTWQQYASEVQEIQVLGPVQLPANSAGLFADFTQLQQVSGFTQLDTSRVTNMARMFQNVELLRTLDLSHWDVSHVTSMWMMFWDDDSLSTLKLTGWRTPSLTNMNGMFAKTALSGLDLDDWDVSHVTDMGSMFDEMPYLQYLAIDDWQTGQVTNMGWMFAETPRLSGPDIQEWDTHQVTRMDDMFIDSGVRWLDLHHWDVSHVTDMDEMFRLCERLTHLDVAGWQTGRVTNMDRMFQGVPATTLAVSDWDVSHVTSMTQMFRDVGVPALDLAHWDVRHVGNFEQMFGRARIKTLDVSGWQTARAASMQKMFIYALVKNLDLSGFDMTHLDYRPNDVFWTDGRVEDMLAYMPALKTVRLGPKNLLLDAHGYTVGLGLTNVDGQKDSQWQAVGTGTVAHPQGQLLSVAELEHHYTSAMADTYVRVPKLRDLRIDYQDIDTHQKLAPSQTQQGLLGSMYTLTPLLIPGYEFVRSSTDSLFGDFMEDPVAVQLYYRRVTVKPDPGPDPDPKPDPEPNPEPTPDPDPDPEPNPEPNPEPTPDPNPTPDPGPSPEPNPNPNPNPEPTPEPNPNPEPNPDPAPDPNPGPNPSPNPTPTPNPGLTPAPTPQPQPVQPIESGDAADQVTPQPDQPVQTGNSGDLITPENRPVESRPAQRQRGQQPVNQSMQSRQSPAAAQPANQQLPATGEQLSRVALIWGSLLLGGLGWYWWRKR
ncbi:MAG: BspA family leucine-rich repeat surface protein [Levilactobacillus sp.]|uniref:BspA family leucine-rich repeat surface protein n=1 Tax=Levilactobacillus sp. TaxID=2767919 RepID=UPI0025828AC8|nr:BspA family leucine-rich repeat surface protein [Levilactobacillus sp.]MCI1554394.1 BspA family leucine-rich repeat surface protein [Levilactobacillus sp.]MCI1598275.1 BspA family leucine-rich repeat surface protein [Levilactobacillus sp.]MCI1605322.1 BspA family leucine-rich repeat surface protein [Levilactobacillus sp.]